MPTSLEQASSPKNKSEQLLKKLYAIPDYGMNAEIAVKSSLPVLNSLKNESQIHLLIAAHLFRYIEIYHPGTDLKIVADEATELLFDVRRDWNVMDIQAFINFMKRNKPNVSGHKITPTEILESAELYEGTRHDAMDIIRQNKKRGFENLPTLKEVYEMLERKKNEASELVIEKDTRPLDEKIVDASRQTQDKKAKWDELVALNLPEQEFLTRWNNFLKNGN